jgi:hypothetical protein
MECIVSRKKDLKRKTQRGMVLTAVVSNPANLLFDCAVQGRVLEHADPVLRLIQC